MAGLGGAAPHLTFSINRAPPLVPGPRQVPLFHCFGLTMGVISAVAHGACVVLPAESFDPEATLMAVDAERCTSLYGAEYAEDELPLVSKYRWQAMDATPAVVFSTSESCS